MRKVFPNAGFEFDMFGKSFQVILRYTYERDLNIKPV